MKQKLIQGIPWAIILALISFIINQCNRDTCENCYSNQETTSFGQEKESNEDFTLTFDCSEKKNFQPVHLDLVNRFGILSLMKIENDSVLGEIKIRLKEINGCKKYSIVPGSLKYLKSKNITHPIDGRKIQHHISLGIEKNNGNRVIEESFKLQHPVIIKEKQLLDIHLVPDSTLNIPSSELEFTDGILTGILRPTTHFGNQQCISEITDDSN